MNPSKAWNAKLEAALFWPSNNQSKQCETVAPGKNPKINKRSGTFIPDSRVTLKIVLVDFVLVETVLVGDPL